MLKKKKKKIEVIPQMNQLSFQFRSVTIPTHQGIPTQRAFADCCKYTFLAT